MLTTLQIVELLREKTVEIGNNPTDYAVAKILGVRPSNVIHWTKYGKSMSDETGLKASSVLGIPDEYILACLAAERAHKTSTKLAWRKVIRLIEPELDLPPRAA